MNYYMDETESVLCSVLSMRLVFDVVIGIGEG